MGAGFSMSVTSVPFNEWVLTNLSGTISLAQTIILALTLAGLVWYVVETRRLRKVGEGQLRLTAMPIVQVSFNLAPPKVFLRNVGVGIAMRTLLQGFHFEDESVTWRCTFEPTQTILPNQEVVLEFGIEREPIDTAHERWSDPRIIFSKAFRRAIRTGHLVLDLYSMDVLGNCYESEARMSWEDFTLFMEFGKPQPRTSSPKLRKGFPNSVEPAEGQQSD